MCVVWWNYCRVALQIVRSATLIFLIFLLQRQLVRKINGYKGVEVHQLFLTSIILIIVQKAMTEFTSKLSCIQKNNLFNFLHATEKLQLHIPRRI
jgi:hypothetical protein